MRTTTLATGVALLCTALPLSACGPGSSGDLGALPTTRPDATTAPPSPPVATPDASPASPARAPAPAPAAGSATREQPVTVEVWLIRDEWVFPTRRTRPHTLATSRLALTELIAGPTGVEAAAGISTAVASGTRFDISIAGGVATVDFPQAFYDGSSAEVRARQAQVVFTLTQFPSVSRVGFQVAGAAAGSPVGPELYQDWLPPIVVTSVAIGDQVTSPVRVAGTANVYEATVSIRILDAAGNPVGTAFTTATCGSGCRGDYHTAVSYRVGSQQRGTLLVYEVSAEDGSPVHVVEIPVTLAASSS
jgi:hypothetical protein